MVGAARLELATPRSQSECATNCATPRLLYFNVKYVNNLSVFTIHCNHFVRVLSKQVEKCLELIKIGLVKSRNVLVAQ